MIQLNKFLLSVITLCLVTTSAHSSELESKAHIYKNYIKHCSDSYRCKTHPNFEDIKKLKQIFFVSSDKRLETIAEYHEAEIKLLKKTIAIYIDILNRHEFKGAAQRAIKSIILSKKTLIDNYNKLSQKDSIFFSQNSSVFKVLDDAIAYTKKWEDEIDRLNSKEAKRTLKYKVSQKFWNKFSNKFKKISKLENRLINKYYNEEIRLRPYDLTHLINFNSKRCETRYNVLSSHRQVYTVAPNYAFLEGESNYLHLFKIPLTEVVLIKKILSGFNGKQNPLSVICIDKGKTSIWGDPIKKVMPGYSKRKNTLYLKRTNVSGMAYYSSKPSDVFELFNIPTKLLSSFQW